ncbi:hypothetical protein O181_045150 [Austropuccinia psidii MF-1]|uniref:Reverse transcriptase/retrotransposon-derived protein RNase H-like domain-containing protein n=1 Tax=Austropuccinia psidii MF-1 TaxID=1389203 RepID=A0A9Q3HKX0_9BASI|nr:hypothetical protein [Austropuccinia psidii MF-1]
MPNLERLYPPVLRRPAYPANPRATEVLESHINKLMKLGVIRNVGHNEEVKVTTPVIVTWNNDKSRMAGDFRALNTYTIPDSLSIPRIHETLPQLSKARFITSMEALKGFHYNFLIPHARKLLRIIAYCGIFEYLRMPFGIKNAPSHYQRMINTIFPHELSEGWLIIYIDDIIICSETWQFHSGRLSLVLKRILQERIQAYENIRCALIKAPLLLMPDWNLPFKLYIDASGEDLGAALHQVQIVNDKPYEGPICFISRQIKPTESRYGASQMECLCLIWALEKLHYYLDGSVLENADGLSRWELPNRPDNPAYVPIGAEPQIPIEGIDITDVGTE